MTDILVLVAGIALVQQAKEENWYRKVGWAVCSWASLAVYVDGWQGPLSAAALLAGNYALWLSRKVPA